MMEKLVFLVGRKGIDLRENESQYSDNLKGEILRSAKKCFAFFGSAQNDMLSKC